MASEQDPANGERRVVQLLAEARAGDRAPERLRARLDAQRVAAQRAPRIRPALAGALTAGIAVLALVLALALPSGTPGGPSVSDAAALASRGAAAPAPPIAHEGRGKVLGASVDELYFPNWQPELGWRAVGERRDRLGGHAALTVYYARGHELVAYTILGLPALREPGAPQQRAGSLTVRTLRVSGRYVVTWRRAGHTCVLSSSTVTASGLAGLAAWSTDATAA